MIEKLEKFISQAVGLSYGLNAEKLLMRKQTIKMEPGMTKDNEEKIVDENRTFFCSELVAKAFKVLGVIVDDDTACSQFLPGTFGVKHDNFLKLTDGTSIDGE